MSGRAPPFAYHASRMAGAIAVACSLHGCAYLFDADGLTLAGGPAPAPSSEAGATGEVPAEGGAAVADDAAAPHDDAAAKRFCSGASLLCLDFDGDDEPGAEVDSTGTLFKGTFAKDRADSVSPPSSALATTSADDGEATLSVLTPAIVGPASLSLRVRVHTAARLTMLLLELHPKGQPGDREGFAVFLSAGMIVLRLKEAYVETETALPSEVWAELRVDFSTRSGDGLALSLDGRELHTRPRAPIAAGAYELRFGAWGAKVALRYDDILLKTR